MGWERTLALDRKCKVGWERNLASNARARWSGAHWSLGGKSLGAPSSLIEEEEGYWERTLASGAETSILGEGGEHTCLWGDRKTTPMSEEE